MISELSSGEILLLCRGALGRWQRLLAEILDHSDPSDAPLRRLLTTRKSEEEASAREFRELDWKVSLSAQPSSNIVKVDSTLREIFPAPPSSHGEEPLNRDAALYYVEIVEEERMRFFRLVGDAGSANGTAHEIAEEHEKSRRRIELLQSVILPLPTLAPPSGAERDEGNGRLRLPNGDLAVTLNSLINTIGVHIRANGRSVPDRPYRGRPREIQDLFRRLLARLDPFISGTEHHEDAEPLMDFTIEMAWLIRAGAFRGSLEAARRFLGLLLKRDHPSVTPTLQAPASSAPERSARPAEGHGSEA